MSDRGSNIQISEVGYVGIAVDFKLPARCKLDLNYIRALHESERHAGKVSVFRDWIAKNLGDSFVARVSFPVADAMMLQCLRLELRELRTPQNLQVVFQIRWFSQSLKTGSW